MAKSSTETSAQRASDKDVKGKPKSGKVSQHAGQGTGKGAGKSAGKSLPKRFYKSVVVAPSEKGFAIKLDERPVRTPQGSEFRVPTKALAEAIGDEWEAQIEVIDPSSMPLTKRSNSTLDGVISNRQLVIDDIAKFSGHDAICYRAKEPADLVARQAEFWDPVITWAEGRFGVRWLCASGVMPVTQLPQTAEAVRQHLRDGCPFQLAALHELTTLAGSALLALAYQDGRLSFDNLWQAANLDEDWQIERWGVDGDAEARRQIRLRDGRAAERLFVLARSV